MIKMSIKTCAMPKGIQRHEFIPKVCQLLLVGPQCIGSVRPVATSSLLDQLECSYENFRVTFLNHKIWKQAWQQFSHRIRARLPLVDWFQSLRRLEMSPYGSLEVRDEPFHQTFICVGHAQYCKPVVRFGLWVQDRFPMILSAVQAEATFAVNEACEISKAGLFHSFHNTVCCFGSQLDGPVWGLGLMQPVGSEAVGV